MRPRLLALTAFSLLTAGTLVLTSRRLDAQTETPVPPTAPDGAARTQALAAATVAAPTNTTPAAEPAADAAMPTAAEPTEAAAAEAAAPVPSQLSAAAQEIVQLAQARVGDTVLLAYIERSKKPYALQKADVLYLRDLGISEEAITAMLRHDGVLEADAAVAAAPDSGEAPKPAATETTEAAPTAESTTAEAPAESASVAERVAAPGATAAAAQPVTYNYFYNTLSPYGTWREVPDYGWCWQPTVAVIDTGWQPYCHAGRWVWTDYGWYWNSYYSWGWAPFHYGRWHCDARWGWMWTPDTCWGPAWVTWRHYGGYHGWAPLPPGSVYVGGVGFRYHGRHVSAGFGFGVPVHHYTFLSTARFHSERPWQYRTPNTVVNNFYGNTTVINNYAVGRGNTIINQGPGTRDVVAATHREVPKVTLQATARPERASPQTAGRLDRSGATLSVYRPNLPPQRAVPPAQVLRRQQESARRSDMLARSEPVRVATETARTRPAESRSPSAATVRSTPQGSTRARTAEQPTRSAPAVTPPSRTSRTATTSPSRRDDSQESVRPTSPGRAQDSEARQPERRTPATTTPRSPTERPSTTPRSRQSSAVTPSSDSSGNSAGNDRVESIRTPASTARAAGAPATAPTPSVTRSESRRSESPPPAPAYRPSAPTPRPTPSYTPPPTMSAPARSERTAPSYTPAPARTERATPSYAPAPSRSERSTPSYSAPSAPAQRSQPSAPASSESSRSSSRGARER